jgi:hypothetical protein
VNFEDEEYVRVYTRKTVTFKVLGWEGRTVLWHLFLEVDRAGVLDLGGEEPVAAVCAMTGLPEDLVSLGLERLTSRGVIVRHESSLLITRFVEAQEAKRTDRVRAKEYRDRVAAKEREAVTRRNGAVTPRDDSFTTVTQRHDSSLLPSPPLPVPIPTPEGRASEPDRSGQPVSSPSSARPILDLTDSETASVVPLDLVERALKLGVIDDLAKALREPKGRIQAGAEEFVGYWSCGGGAGQKCSRWMRKMREHIRRSAQQGKLPEAASDTGDGEAASGIHPVAKARLERMEAQRREHHAKLAAEFEASGGTAVRDVRKLTEGIGG